MSDEHRLFTTRMGLWEKDVLQHGTSMVSTYYTFHFHDHDPIIIDAGNTHRIGAEHYLTPLYGETVQVEWHCVKEYSSFDGHPLHPQWLEIRVITGKYSGETIRIKSDWAWEDSYDAYKQKHAEQP